MHFSLPMPPRARLSCSWQYLFALTIAVTTNFGLPRACTADTVTLSAVDRGWYDTATYTFESDSLGIYSSYVPSTGYPSALETLELTVDGQVYAKQPSGPGSIEIANDVPAGNFLWDRCTITAYGIAHPPLAAGLSVSFIQADFFDWTGLCLTDYSLVTSAAVLQSFGLKNGRIVFSNNEQADFEIASISVVPEPASVFLANAGIAGSACCSLRRRRKNLHHGGLLHRLFTACSLILVALPGAIAHAELLLTVSPGVVLSPGTATIGGVATGPLNGTQYGPVGYNSAPGGTTGFVTSSLVIPASSSSYQLIWEVSNVGDTTVPSALAIDNVRITSGSSTATVFGFESGIPEGFISGEGSFSGTSAAVANLAPTEGTAFAYMDTSGAYDTAMGTNGSRLISAMFSAAAGDILEIDTAFLTNDSTSQYGDYGFAALSTDGGATLSTVLFTAVAPVPEPSTWMMGTGGLAYLVWRVWWRRRNQRHLRRSITIAASLAVVALLLAITPAHGQVTIDWVTVGDPGPWYSSGDVEYDYKIMRCE